MSNKTVYPWQKYSKNPLIVKDDVGKAKPNTYPIPNCAFGTRTVPGKEESLGEVLCHMEHFASMEIRPERDFKKTNIMSIKRNLCTAKEFQEFRQSHDIRQKVVQGKPRINETPKQQVFGRKNKTPSPIKNVLAYDYGAVAEKQQAEAYTPRPSTAKSRISAETKSSKLLKETIKKNHLMQSQPEQLKKLSQFANVKAKTKTRY
ncbi:unnamed protein product [Paramecium primaurelia]|uniref:Uncharacterized protein n=1 Tax=Paramecium primaurelia TaxID=5886 RepID=A0A8S1QDT4_PARPR|nr:unnamed protein product [Paramecium primaurelia]